MVDVFLTSTAEVDVWAELQDTEEKLGLAASDLFWEQFIGVKATLHRVGYTGSPCSDVSIPGTRYIRIQRRGTCDTAVYFHPLMGGGSLTAYEILRVLPYGKPPSYSRFVSEKG